MESDRSSVDESIHGLLKPVSAARVSLVGAARTFSGRAAVLPTTLTLQPGEFVSLLGPSGSGKSTLLRMMAGLESADQGHVIVEAGSKSLTKSFVFQDPALLPWRTVLNNVLLPFEISNSVKKSRERAEAALSQVGLADALDLYPNQLSGGMRMRVSVARAIVSEPSLLLLDEPFAALDERVRFRLQEDLRELWLSLKMTTIFVTHSVSEAVFVSNRALVVSSAPGRIVLDHAINLGDARMSALRTSVEYQQEIEIVNRAFDEGSDDRSKVTR